MTENAALPGTDTRTDTGTDRSAVLLIGVLLVAAFVVILLVLFFMPRGIFGKSSTDRV